MWDFLPAFFNGLNFNEIVEVIRKLKTPNSIYRDELDKKPSPSKLKKSANGVLMPRSSDCLASSKPLLQREENWKNSERRRSCTGSTTVEEKGVIRVKILMTKQEAARLLSKCNDGGSLEFKDVARALVQIPMDCVSVVSPSTSRDNWVLESIPEEL